MGSCINSKQGDVIQPNQFKKDEKIGENLYKPLTSTLYNCLRKRNDIEILRNANIQQPIFFGQITYQISQLKINDMKMLFNFKYLLLIDPQQSIIEQIRKSCSPKTIFSITKQQAQQFVSEFPIFGAKQQKLQPRLIPILAFNQQETIRSKGNKMVFLHSQKYKNETTYSKLKIITIATQQSQLKASLENIQSQRILYLHPVGLNQQKLLDLMTQSIQASLNISSSASRKYFDHIFPQTKTLQKFNQIKTQNIIKISDDKATISQKLQQNFQKLKQEMGSEQVATGKLQRAYNLIVNLTTNIYNNKQSQNFRKVKKTNKQINDMLGRYKYGIKMLQDMGFIDEGGFYVNNTDIKYLKIFRTDLDLAYRNYLNTNSQ